MIDTSVLIAFFRNQLDEKSKRYLNGGVATLSIITRFEFEKWLLKVHRSSEREFLKQRLESTFETIGLDTEICEKAAYYAHSEGLSTADALIYATARVSGLNLATSDSDFKGKPGVLFAEPKK